MPSNAASLLTDSSYYSMVMNASSIRASQSRCVLANIGAGYDLLQPDDRNSDRIIWDSQEIVDIVYARIENISDVKEELSSLNDENFLLEKRKSNRPGGNWDFRLVNKRLGFLRYQGGQFLRSHRDGSYAEDGPEATLGGGATSSLPRNQGRKFFVDTKAGRVLIFQHSSLYHSDDDVLTGTKYIIVCTDIMYALRRDKASTAH
ncbi:oxidoreductase [Calycina marina]|uniref:Oxidoreductase n=1 Tax=Calycina marina TaxID=1763456 RepID=A0A9P8CEB4_9HELO|nr:oxidoreductase [Calycina marina]